MSQFFAFLRAINAGKGRTVKMDALRQAFESLGFSGVETFIASGNVVFETRATDVGAIEKKIERGLEQALGLNVPVFIRTPAELKKIAAFEPFEDLKFDGAVVNIILLADTLDEKSKPKLAALKTEDEVFRAHGREIYWWRSKRPGTAPYSTVPLEQAIRVPFTVRGTNTIRKLVEKWP